MCGLTLIAHTSCTSAGALSWHHSRVRPCHVRNLIAYVLEYLSFVTQCTQSQHSRGDCRVQDHRYRREHFGIDDHFENHKLHRHGTQKHSNGQCQMQYHSPLESTPQQQKLSLSLSPLFILVARWLSRATEEISDDLHPGLDDSWPRGMTAGVLGTAI